MFFFCLSWASAWQKTTEQHHSLFHNLSYNASIHKTGLVREVCGRTSGFTPRHIVRGSTRLSFASIIALAAALFVGARLRFA
jgi:hypothetical protein